MMCMHGTVTQSSVVALPLTRYAMEEMQCKFIARWTMLLSSIL